MRVVERNLEGVSASRKNAEKTGTAGDSAGVPCVEGVKSYLAAFDDGLPVNLLPPLKRCFTAWKDGESKPSKTKASSAIPPFIGIDTFSECTCIRTRPTSNDAFPFQLNLDLLDAAITMLPDDAYALLLLANHDLYEDDDDEFVQDRAYGGSRVAPISAARYNPGLNEKHGVQREHSRPLSHRSAYMKSCGTDALGSTARPKKKIKAKNSDTNQPSLSIRVLKYRLPVLPLLPLAKPPLSHRKPRARPLLRHGPLRLLLLLDALNMKHR